MTQTEYEQKRREGWEEYKRHNLDGEVQWQPVSRYDIFCAAFDRAYALGREKETITQEEIESNAVGYAMDVNNDRLSTYPEAMRPQLYPEYDMDDLANAFKAGANFALGKQEKKKPSLTDKEVYALESAISELESLMDGTLDEDYHKEQKIVINALKRIIKKYEKK